MSTPIPTTTGEAAPPHFLRALVAADKAAGRHNGRVVTRFPPEPNGYLHIGHSKSICLNFGLAAEFGGVCHLRYDDTNPSTEDEEYVASILETVRWLGFDPAPHIFYASDYFEALHDYAVYLIRKGKAYVCDLSEEQIREYRGTVTEAGRASPWRERAVAENLDLFARMRAGEFADGSRVLRAKIDMADPNMKMRDPLLYRIKHEHHYRTKDRWCIYPFYDFAHCLSDAIEKVTHSICTLEFENNRELYDWILAECDIEDPPRQYEFARLNLTWTVMSKRRLLQLVEGGHVSGWDDPRMPTLAGMRRRGVTPEALRAFCERIGVAKANSVVEVELLENTLRDELNASSPRAMAVLRPLKVTLTNWPEGRVETLHAPHFPPEAGRTDSRALSLSRTLYIEATDFSGSPPPGWKRLVPGGEVRLRHGPVIRCDDVVRHDGQVVELRCSADLDTLGGRAPEGRKVKGILHWVDGATAVPCEIRLYDRLIRVERPGADDFITELNPDSLTVVQGVVEPAGAAAGAPAHWQFERNGYFFRDPVEDAAGKLVFNRVVGLKEGWVAEPAATATVGPTATAGKPRDASTQQAATPAVASGKAVRELDPAVAARRDALVERYGIADAAARTIAAEPELVALFESALTGARPDVVATYVSNAVVGELRAAAVPPTQVSGAAIGRIVALVEAGTLGSPQARRVLSAVVREGADPDAIVAAEGLSRLSDEGALAALVTQVFDRFPAEAGRFSGGQVQLAGFFVGQVLKASGGRADATVVQRLVRARGPA